MPVSRSFLELLYEGASQDALDEVVASAEAAGATHAELADLRAQRSIALRLRERIQRQKHREAELTALYETANDLIAIRDVDAILAAIVRRARQLLGADMTYLSLNDEEEGASYMKVTDGSVSAEFRNLRLPLGTGLLGLVAQRGAPYYTGDYQHDARFVHQDYIDHAVHDERIRAILGVPLIVEGKVIGALLAGHRSVRAFPPSEVTLLTSFAAHAAVALENARLFEATRTALAEVDAANQQIRSQARSVESAAEAHDRLTDVLLHGGGVDEVARVLGDVLEGALTVYDADGRAVAVVGEPAPTVAEILSAVLESRTSGRSVETTVGGHPVWVAAALAGAEHLGTVVLHRRSRTLELGDRRTIERGAVVTALVLLFSRSMAEAEDRVRGEVLTDLLSGRESDAGRLRERARRHGADLDRLRVVAVADVGKGDRHRAVRLAARYAAELGGLGGEQEGATVLVAPGEDPLAVGRGLADRLSGEAGVDGTVTVGVSAVAGPGRAPDALVAVYFEARSCLATLVTLGRVGEVSDSAGLGLARLVLGYNGPVELGGFLRGTLGPLLEYDDQRGTELVRTLDLWFASGGSLAETGRRLHVHPNTVTQRLARIGSLLGADWRAPQRALEQQLAIQLWRLQHADRPRDWGSNP